MSAKGADVRQSIKVPYRVVKLLIVWIAGLKWSGALAVCKSAEIALGGCKMLAGSGGHDGLVGESFGAFQKRS